jgi:hypothetical protein
MIGVPPPAIASEASHVGKVKTQAVIGPMVKRIKFFSIWDIKNGRSQTLYFTIDRDFQGQNEIFK